LIFQNGIEENYHLSSLVAQSGQMFDRGSTNDAPIHVRPDIQSQAMKPKNFDVVEFAEVDLQPNKKRQMLRGFKLIEKTIFSKVVCQH
jgi:hypothetical protein